MKKSNGQLLLMLVLTASLALLSGCTSNDQTPASQQGGTAYRVGAGNGSGQGMPRNLTDAQRQQFLQEMVQACQNKAEGDSCALQTPMGGRTGTCKTMNETLSCVTGMGGPMRANRSAANPGS